MPLCVRQASTDVHGGDLVGRMRAGHTGAKSPIAFSLAPVCQKVAEDGSQCELIIAVRPLIVFVRLRKMIVQLISIVGLHIWVTRHGSDTLLD
jgi:hypothetical protein